MGICGKLIDCQAKTLDRGYAEMGGPDVGGKAAGFIPSRSGDKNE